MERRKFLGTGAAMATLAAPRWLLGQTCQPTQADLYGSGPFYLQGAPARVRLSRPTEAGEALSIRGVVSDCNRPLSEVKLEVWHATHSGCYIFPQARCDLADGEDTEARLWGLLLPDAEGRYAFDTIKPGRYLNGDRYRPSHIHFRISAPGRNVFSGGRDFFYTQLYFEGDEYIKGDYAADHGSAAGRIIPLSRQGTGPLNGTFNINLPAVPAATGSRDMLMDPALGHFDASVHRRGSRLLFQLPPAPSGATVELRLYGVDGTLAKRSTHRILPIEVDATFLPPGVYQAELRWWTSQGLRQEKLKVNV